MSIANSGSIGRGKAFIETRFPKVLVSRLAVSAADRVSDFNIALSKRCAQKNPASRKFDRS